MAFEARFTPRAQRLFLRWGTALYATALFTGTHLPPRVIRVWSPSLLENLSDKALHFGGYLVLSTLMALTLGTFRKLTKREFVGVWIVAAVLGALDEWTQLLPSVNRSAELLDWVADITGSACGLGIAAWICARKDLGVRN